MAFAAVQPAHAQPVPSEATAQIVAQVTDAFFTQLVAEDFATERGFLADSFAANLSAEDWQDMRERVIARTGATPLCRPHKLTFYQQQTLLAAVDYAGQAEQDGTFICGYVLWSFSSENSLGLTRFEQNIVEAEVLKEMELPAAVELMTGWQCPPPLIEALLNVTLQPDNQ